MKNQTETMQCMPSKSRRFTQVFIPPEVKGNLQGFYIFCFIFFIILSPLCCPPYLAFSSSVRRHPKSRIFLLYQPGFPISQAAPDQLGEHLRQLRTRLSKDSPSPLWKATQAHCAVRKTSSLKVIFRAALSSLPL